MSEKYTAQQMIEVIQDAKGILTVAARKLECSRNTVYRYINKYATVKDAYEEANESNIDFVETKLMEQINKGNITAIIFFLKTKAKHRGYVERQSVDLTTGGEKINNDNPERYDRAISTFADAIGEILSGQGAAEKDDVGTAEHTPMDGTTIESG